MIVSRFLCVSLSLFSSFSFYFLLSLWGPIYVCAAITASFCLFLCSSLFISVSCFLPYPSLSPSRGCCALWVPLSTPTTPRSMDPSASTQVSPGSHPPRRNPTFSHQVAEESQPQGCSPWRVRCSDPDWNGALSVTAAAKAGRGPRTSPGTVGKPRLQRARSHWTVTEKRQALWSCFILQLSSPKLAGRGHRLSTVLCMRKVFPNHYLTHCRWKQKASLILHSDVWLSVDALRLSFSREERDASAHS